MAKNYRQGIFTPRHPEKYRGDARRIEYRSGWELKLMMYLDRHPDILQWSSEEMWIPYWNPVKKKTARYFPDFFVKRRKKDGTIELAIIEVKPKSETMPPPVMSGKRAQTKSYLYKIATFATNAAKWAAADKYCKAKGWKFIIMTAEDLGIK
jgi:hypothetical protein